MDHGSPSPSMEEVQKILDSNPASATKAVFLFLYKEILVNRLMILEAKPHENTANAAHYEKQITELNEKLMQHMK